MMLNDKPLIGMTYIWCQATMIEFTDAAVHLLNLAPAADIASVSIPIC